MNIGVIGTGYVGLVAGAGFADAGHHVICVDTDTRKIKDLKRGKLPIYEPGLSDVIARAERRLKFTTEISDAIESCNILFVAVGTPPRPDGSADMSASEAVVKSICEQATSDTFIVLKSTVPIGTARHYQSMADEIGQTKIEIVNNPEFLKEGAAVEDFLRPDRIVIGCRSERAKNLMAEVYDPFVRSGRPILFMDNASAEMTKYAANAFLAIKISFINELANMADLVGADITQVKNGFTSDYRINPSFFHAGVGYGGSCFPKDVKALQNTAGKFDTTMKIAKAADEVNNEQKLILLRKVKAHYKDLAGKRFSIWGLSFKPRTDDVRDAPALLLIQALTEAGATVVGYDPIAGENALEASPVKFRLADSAYDALKDSDGLFVVTEWSEFRGPDFSRMTSLMKEKVIFDGRNIFDPPKMRDLGFTYYCIGRQSVS